MRKRRIYLVALLVALAVGITAILWNRSSREPGARPYLGVPEQRQRIDRIIAELGSETFDESVGLLAEPSSYYSPGFQSQKKADQTNIEEALSNRRCVKILNELEMLSESDREARCRQAFDLVFRTHCNAMRAGLRHAEDPSSPKNTQSLRASQLGLCTAMLATARHASTEALKIQFAALDNFEDEIDQRLTKEAKSFSPNVVLVARGYCTPDNRAQLNVLCVHGDALRDDRLSKAVKETCRDFPGSDLPIVNWNAHTTWFDAPRRLEGVPLDTSKGITLYRLYEWPEAMYLERESQRQTIKRIRKLIFAER
jgi:hypothetical protein